MQSLNVFTAREFVLADYPTGTPAPQHFKLVTRRLADLNSGEVRIRTRVWGVDPGLRSRLSSVASYVPSLRIGEAVSGFVAGEVLQSADSRFAPGDIVTGSWGWRDFANVDANLVALAPKRGALPMVSLLGLLGVPGITAYFGMLDVGQVKPGDQVLVTSAAGGVGSIASQIARIKGAHVVGLAGGATKCAWLKDSLGLDDVIDYKATPDVGAALGTAFVDGIDLVFENTGNQMVDTVLPCMRTAGRIVICGQTADYNVALSQRHGIRNTSAIISRRLRLQGLLCMDYAAHYSEARADLEAWAQAGKIITTEHITVGFEQLAQAFASLFQENELGRRLVVSDAELLPVLPQPPSNAL